MLRPCIVRMRRATVLRLRPCINIEHTPVRVEKVQGEGIDVRCHKEKHCVPLRQYHDLYVHISGHLVVYRVPESEFPARRPDSINDQIFIGHRVFRPLLDRNRPSFDVKTQMENHSSALGLQRNVGYSLSWAMMNNTFFLHSTYFLASLFVIYGSPVGFPMGDPWETHGRTMGDPCENHGRPAGIRGRPMVYPGQPLGIHGRPMANQWTRMGAHGDLIGDPPETHGNPWEAHERPTGDPRKSMKNHRRTLGEAREIHAQTTVNS